MNDCASLLYTALPCPSQRLQSRMAGLQVAECDFAAAVGPDGHAFLLPRDSLLLRVLPCPSAPSPVGLIYLHFPRKNRLSAGIFHEPEQHVPVSQGSVLVDMCPPGRAFYRRARVQEIEQIPDVVLSKASPVIDGPFRAHESTAAVLAEVSFPAVRAYMPVADEPFRVAVRAFRRLRIVYHLDRLISPSAVFVSSKCRKSRTDHARYFREFRNPRKWEYR